MSLKVSLPNLYVHSSLFLSLDVNNMFTYLGFEKVNFIYQIKSYYLSI